jgi:hypothetical protein
MKLNITKRDFRFFLIGVLTLLLVELIWDWDANVKAFKEGCNAAGADKTEVQK